MKGFLTGQEADALAFIAQVLPNLSKPARDIAIAMLGGKAGPRPKKWAKYFTDWAKDQERM